MFKFLHQDQWFITLILVVGILLLTFSSLLLRFDYVFYDIGQYILPKKAPEDIVIIAIDEPSIDKLGKWPWSRETHAYLLSQVNKSKPKAIAFDVLFAEPDRLYPKDDLQLMQAVQKASNVILPVVLESPYPGAPVRQKDSLATFVEQASGVGRVNIPLDGDGIARGVYLWEGLSNANKTINWLPHFAQAALTVANELPRHVFSKPELIENNQASVTQAQYKKIRFYGEASSFQQVSFVDVWSGLVPKVFFDGKIILIGATAIGMGDLISTPMSSFSSPMSGVEFNANVVAAMRDGELITEMPLWLNGLIAVLLVVLPVFWLPNQTPSKSLLLLFVYVIAILSCSIVMPNYLHIWFKPSALILMILLTYPIWSWRRLKRAHAHLNVELQQLKEDLMEFGLQPDQVGVGEQKVRFRDDLLQSRISQVRYASSLLRDLQHKKDETLAFISHDLRMPLATAMMMLNEDDFVKKKSRISAMLNQANELAESFLSISKAENLSAASFRELELSGLVQESVDNVFQLVKQKSIKVKLTLPDEPIWIQGDFTLLHRACVNILNNAIKFSPNNGLVEVVLAEIDGEAHIMVKDYGPGIEQEKLDQVFVKFKRLDGQPIMQGSGLGLYFVDVTVTKHNGEVFAESELGQWTKFTMQIPVLEMED